MTSLRPSNRALDFLISHNQPMDDKLKKLIDDLPRITDGLYSYAQESAVGLVVGLSSNRLVRVGKRLLAIFSGTHRHKVTPLTLCIFDLQMSAVFSTLLKHLGGKEAASVLVDAMVYQATGSESNSPTEAQLMYEGTQNVRGIHKYQLTHQKFPHFADSEGWAFGKEYSAIQTGSPMDIAYVVSVSSFSLLMRIRASWMMRYFLYGTRPTKEEQDSLQELLDKQEEDFKKMIDSLSAGADKSAATSRVNGP